MNGKWFKIAACFTIRIAFWNWRRLAIGGLAVMAAVPLPAALPRSSNSSAYEELRLRWCDMLTGGENLKTNDPVVAARLSTLSTEAQSLWAPMDKSVTRTFLWSDLGDVTRNSGQMWNSYHLRIGDKFDPQLSDAVV